MIKLVNQQSHAGDHHWTNINYKMWLFRMKTGVWKLVNQHVFLWLSCLTELVLLSFISYKTSFKHLSTHSLWLKRIHTTSVYVLTSTTCSPISVSGFSSLTDEVICQDRKAQWHKNEGWGHLERIVLQTITIWKCLSTTGRYVMGALKRWSEVCVWIYWQISFFLSALILHRKMSGFWNACY